MVVDPIANFIIALKNANTAGKETVSVSFSKLKLAVATLLEKEGYIASVETKGEGVKKTLELGLVYGKDDAPRITDVKRISKFSLRVYKSAKDIFPIKNGKGLLVLSTPAGVISGKEARKSNVGGEVLFSIW